MDREEILSENIVKLFGIIYGQCTLALKAMVKGDDKYTDKSINFDEKWLLGKLKVITAGVEIKANFMLSLHKQLIVFFTTRQGLTKLDEEYLNHFNSQLKNLELSSGDHMIYSPKLLKKTLGGAKLSDDDIEKDKEKFRAICFLVRLDENRYRNLLISLRKSVFLGRDEYPKTLASTYDFFLGHPER